MATNQTRTRERASSRTDASTEMLATLSTRGVFVAWSPVCQQWFVLFSGRKPFRVRNASILYKCATKAEALDYCRSVL